MATDSTTTTQKDKSLLGGLLGDASVDINVKLDSEQYIFFGLAVAAGMLVGALMADLLKAMIKGGGTS